MLLPKTTPNRYEGASSQDSPNVIDDFYDTSQDYLFSSGEAVEDHGDYIDEESFKRVLGPSKLRNYQDWSTFDSTLGRQELEFYDLKSRLDDLRKQLFELRYELSNEMDCSANSIFSNTVLDGLVRIRPTMRSTLLKVEGLSDQRRNQLSLRLISFISEYCTINGIPTDCSDLPHYSTIQFTPEIEMVLYELTDSERECYKTHLSLLNGSLGEVGNRLYSAPLTALHVLTKCARIGLPLRLTSLGIARYHIDLVFSLVDAKTSRDLSSLDQVMDLLPAGLLDYNQLRVVFAVLEYEYGLMSPSMGKNLQNGH